MVREGWTCYDHSQVRKVCGKCERYACRSQCMAFLFSRASMTPSADPTRENRGSQDLLCSKSIVAQSHCSIYSGYKRHVMVMIPLLRFCATVAIRHIGEQPVCSLVCVHGLQNNDYENGVERIPFRIRNHYNRHRVLL